MRHLAATSLTICVEYFAMVKNIKPKFDFGEPSANLEKALQLLKSAKSPTVPNQGLLQWAENEILKEEIRRVYIIAAHYNIPLFYSQNLGLTVASSLNFHSLNLVRKLASDFVLGFNPANKKPGNPTSVLEKHSKLIEAIDKEIEEKNIRLAQAIRNICKKGRVGADLGDKAVEDIYHRGKKQLVAIETVLKDATKQKLIADKEYKALKRNKPPLGLLSIKKLGK
jgi:hypothetical protein